MVSHKITRRTFTQTTAVGALGLTALSARQVLGANERIRLGFIGVANRGGQVMDALLNHSDCQIAALCDVDKGTLEKANAKVDGRAELYSDFRKLLERKDLDAVVIATPDHWHALQTIYACRAGKDVYVEKPLSITIYEGRRMVEEARKHKRVVQVGTNRRSSPLYAQLAQWCRADKVGKITVSRAYRLSNMAPGGIGRAQPSEPPPGLDWDLWLGPRPAIPYRETIAPYKFRWWTPYSSQMANWGVHYLDLMRWMTNELAPASIGAMGGRFAVEDDRTIPDTMEACFQFASGRLFIFGQYEASGNPMFPYGELELRGVLGTVYASDRMFKIVPERGGQFQDPKPRMEPMEQPGPSPYVESTVLHARNFLDCI
ncbi:MAG TPA: Gfo/Idh/MocA family oxidoreductase, partial [Thermoguttaceae bacterium]|nr:Gfo/Idh/MocA family oxidoreductase [Thermoguttaceae bacterium]